MKVFFTIALFTSALFCEAQTGESDLDGTESGWTRPLENIDMSEGKCWRITLTEIFNIGGAHPSEKRKLGGNRHLERVEKEWNIGALHELAHLKNEFRLRLHEQIDGEHEFVIRTYDKNCKQTEYVFDSKNNFDFGELESLFTRTTTTYHYSKGGYKKSVIWTVTKHHY